MNWPKPAAANSAVLCVLALAGLGGLRCEAQVKAASMPGLEESVSSVRLDVRHRLRKHRRIRRSQTHAKPFEPDMLDAHAAKTEMPSQPSKPPLKGSEPEKPSEAVKPPEPMGPPPPTAWTAAEVEAARSECERRLAGLHIIFDPLHPIREGACGLPSPIRLRGFASQRAPQLAFDSAPTMSCKMAQALRRWFDDVLQPKAKTYLHATIVRITTLSGYDCRPRYDDPAQRLSQHAYANALDIGEFVTAKGERIGIAEAWNDRDERAAFLHDAHDGACVIFGTTLGPEANDAHRDHFHLDMTERRQLLCDLTSEQARAREQAKQAAALAAAARRHANFAHIRSRESARARF